MKIVGFLDKNNIEWVPIHINANKQPHHPVLRGNFVGQNEWLKAVLSGGVDKWNFTLADLKKRPWSELAIVTTSIAMIDVDYHDTENKVATDMSHTDASPSS